MNKRKLFVVCMLFAILVGMVPQERAVANEVTYAVQPRYSNLQTLTLAFGVDASTGTASSTAVCLYYESCTDYVQIRLELQQYTEEAGWTTIYTTIENLHNNPDDTGFTRAVTKGYTYRSVATVDLYKDGVIAETVRVISVTDSY